MDTIRMCSQCLQPLPEEAPEGLCPACLAKVALGSEPAGPGATINIDPPAAAAPPPRVAPDPAQLSAQFPQLEIIELLGMGGMGMVYKARQPRLDRFVALKILPMDSAQHPDFAERFNREAKALARLNHPGIVIIYDFGQTSQYYFFVMEYVDGMNLRSLLSDQTVTPRQALELVVQICTALQYAHDEGVVHRDIKPENILLNKKGQVKIADFGLAKLLGNEPATALTMSQAAMGTLNYMAPEQRQNAQAVDHRADIYSLGVVFYEMLTGEVPMGRFEPPSKRVQVDVRLDEVVLRALEREPDRRYQQVSEVRTSVETISSSLSPKSPPGDVNQKDKPPAGQKFSSRVSKFFVVSAAVWVVVAIVLRIVMGDFDMVTSVTSGPSGAVTRWSLGPWVITPDQNQHPLELTALTVVGAVACAFSLKIAWIALPALLSLGTSAWFSARAQRGLTLRRLPPFFRRRFWKWVVAASGGFVLVAFGTMAYWNLSTHIAFPSPQEFQNLQDEAAEWYYIPASGAYEKLGLNLRIARPDKSGTNDSNAWPASTVSLTLHRTNAEALVMKVTLPGLRSSYRFPVTNNWDYTFILDQAALTAWLQKTVASSALPSKFQDEAGEIYQLLKSYEIQPPQTAKEFINMAKADLRDFSFGGWQGAGFSVGGVQGPGGFLFGALMGIEALLYLAALTWMEVRLYREVWTEIEAGRLTLNN